MAVNFPAMGAPVQAMQVPVHQQNQPLVQQNNNDNQGDQFVLQAPQAPQNQLPPNQDNLDIQNHQLAQQQQQDNNHPAPIPPQGQLHHFNQENQAQDNNNAHHQPPAVQQLNAPLPVQNLNLNNANGPFVLAPNDQLQQEDQNQVNDPALLAQFQQDANHILPNNENDDVPMPDVQDAQDPGAWAGDPMDVENENDGAGDPNVGDAQDQE